MQSLIATLCYNALMQKKVKFAYVNFDDERLIQLKGEELNDVLEVLYKIYGDFNYLFIDEIQNIPEWYLFVNRLLRRQMHIVITSERMKENNPEELEIIRKYNHSFEEHMKSDNPELYNAVINYRRQSIKKLINKNPEYSDIDRKSVV